MASEYYPSADTADSGAAPPGADPMAENKPADDKAEGQTFLAPKSAIGDDANPGDLCVFRIVTLHDEEAELEYVRKEEPQEGSGDKPEMGESMAGMDKMASMSGA